MLAIDSVAGSSRGPGSGASGAVHDLLNEDKRRAIEIIVEGRAEHRDPETADLPPDDGEQAASSPGTARGSRISARRS
jgi:hypothetical protein